MTADQDQAAIDAKRREKTRITLKIDKFAGKRLTAAGSIFADGEPVEIHLISFLQFRAHRYQVLLNSIDETFIEPGLAVFITTGVFFSATQVYILIVVVRLNVGRRGFPGLLPLGDYVVFPNGID